MKCPFCAHVDDKVIDSREGRTGDTIRRRRECLKCGRRFTTYERIDEIPYMVVKKDGRREKFDRQKVLNGLLRACEKRPVPISKLEQIVNEAETFVIESPERERKSSEVGELIMSRLRRYDKVAYVRFASVYLDFKDVQEFMSELKDALGVPAMRRPCFSGCRFPARPARTCGGRTVRTSAPCQTIWIESEYVEPTHRSRKHPLQRDAKQRKRKNVARLRS